MLVLHEEQIRVTSKSQIVRRDADVDIGKILPKRRAGYGHGYDFVIPVVNRQKLPIWKLSLPFRIRG